MEFHKKTSIRHANVSLTKWNKPCEATEILVPLEPLPFLNLPCVTVVKDRTSMSRIMLGTSLSVSTSIDGELQLKQQEMFDNFQVKTADILAHVLWTRHAIVRMTSLSQGGISTTCIC